MNKITKILAAAMAATLLMASFAGCGGGNTSSTSSTASTGSSSTEGGESSTGTPTADTSKEVSVSMYLYGSEGVANPDILAALNEKLKASINATLEVKYIDWGDVATKYPLLFASGEKFDMAYTGPGTPISMSENAKQGSFADLTPMLDLVPELKAAIPEKEWKGTTVDGKIIAVPCLYTEFTPTGFVLRDDILEENKLEVNSIETLEKYMDAVVAKGEMAPLNGNATDALNMYRILIGETGNWVDVPGVFNGQMYLAADYDNPGEIFYPVFTDEFEAWVTKMADWSKKGYWPTDILASQVGAKDNFNNGVGAMFITHQPDWTGNYGALERTQPGLTTSFWSPTVDNGKILNKPGSSNATAISINSENPERALMVIEKLMMDEECYRLMQYGIEGRKFEFVDGVAQEVATYNKDTDDGGFAAWALRNDAFNIPYATEDPRRYTLNDEWKSVAIDDPFFGFSFDPSKVSTEISSITNINAQLGNQLLLGKTTDDVATALAQYRSQLTDAGIDKVVEEVKTQYKAFAESSK